MKKSLYFFSPWLLKSPVSWFPESFKGFGGSGAYGLGQSFETFDGAR